jgi:DNA-binding transcriptional MerR regulator
MKIGELSKTTGTNIETVRYYERIGLLPAPDRTAANYRSYGEPHRARLAFVLHSRELGFTIQEVRSLLDLSDHPDRDWRATVLQRAILCRWKRRSRNSKPCATNFTHCRTLPGRDRGGCRGSGVRQP